MCWQSSHKEKAIEDCLEGNDVGIVGTTWCPFLLLDMFQLVVHMFIVFLCHPIGIEV